jgi:(p)ppGpp synthase/HD superfamily hydrolase
MSERQWAGIAQDIAKRNHFGQFRRDGITPYINHPAAVADAVESDYAKAVAWLHDVLEDTHVTVRDLELIFPTQIVDAVIALTMQYGQSYEKYMEAVAKHPIARLVKIADIKHNLSDDPTEKQVRKYADALRFLESRDEGETK